MGYEFQEYLKNENIKSITTTVYNSTGNSLFERLNQEISKCLRIKKGESFANTVMKPEEAINALYNRSIKQIPREVFKHNRLGKYKITEEQVNSAIRESQSELSHGTDSRAKKIFA